MHGHMNVNFVTMQGHMNVKKENCILTYFCNLLDIYVELWQIILQ
jgi:hypothetical protein